MKKVAFLVLAFVVLVCLVSCNETQGFLWGHTVSFDAGSQGNNPNSQFVADNTKAQKPADPVSKDGCYDFVGWYTDSTYAEEFDFENTPVLADTKLVAKWVENGTLLLYFPGNSEPIKVNRVKKTSTSDYDFVEKFVSGTDFGVEPVYDGVSSTSDLVVTYNSKEYYVMGFRAGSYYVELVLIEKYNSSKSIYFALMPYGSNVQATTILKNSTISYLYYSLTPVTN